LVARSQVVEAYDLVFRRWPDPVGLAHFSELLFAGPLTQAELIMSLYTSEEARSRSVNRDGGSDDDRMAALSNLFRSAQAGSLVDDHVDASGDRKVGAVVERLLGDDLSKSILIYNEYYS